MVHDKARLEQPKQTARERILDAAERLLGQGGAAFSMRELAQEAGMSFATPFNQFGSKAAIMLALSARRIDAMRDQLAQAALPAAAAARVLAAVDIATAAMLSAPAVNRAVMGAVGAPTDEPGNVSAQSSALWAAALGPGAGLASTTRSLALATLPDQLAVAFRGVLSFWTAGELPDQLLNQRARAAAAAVLLGFVGRDGRAELLTIVGSPAVDDRFAMTFAAAGLGIVIAGAMLANLVAGALGGILVPLTLEHVEIDPAVSSSAFVTTVTDVVGNFSFFGVASLWVELS